MQQKCAKASDLEVLHPKVYVIRGQKVVLDRDLAAALGVETRVINQKVKRNINLFNEDSMFQLTFDECTELEISGSKSQNSGLSSQNVISNNTSRGGSRYLPFAFTQAGVQVLKTLMKSSVDIDFSDEPPLPTIYEESWSEGTVVLYQPNENLKIDVRVENETVWLTQEQMALLFGTTTQNITIHIGNIFEEKEVEERATCKDFLQVQIEGEREVRRTVKLYNLNKRTKGVSATVYTNHRNLSDPQIQLDFTEANKKREAPLIQMLEIKNDHDRFLIIDNTSYLLGPSIKDAGVNRCAVVKMISAPDKILKDLVL